MSENFKIQNCSSGMKIRVQANFEANLYMLYTNHNLNIVLTYFDDDRFGKQF